jgi:hypothetical protein
MSTDKREWLYQLMGLTLQCVQDAEHYLTFVARTVLKNPKLKLLEQTEAEQRRTLNDVLKELKTHVRLEHDFKERLYKFRSMRNTFVHNISEVPGANFRTAEGQQALLMFVAELLMLSSAISFTMVAAFSIAIRDELGEEIVPAHMVEEKELMVMLEKYFGKKARALLKGRTWPALKPPTPLKQGR